LKWATGAGAINMGFPALFDTDVPVVHPRGVTIYEEVEKELDQDKLVETAIMQRGLKIITHKVDIPVAFGPAFEGERIRKEDAFLEWGGGKTPAFELCVMRDLDKVQDGKITIIGEENKEKIEKGGQIPLGIIVEVAGRKMEKDFEPVVERKFHDFINEAQGVWQMGQRDIIWGRISKTAQSEGFRLHHLGTIFTSLTKKHYPAIIDKVQVTIYLDEKDILKHQEEAKKIFTERNERVSNMTDESVDTFYSCTLCQSFAPTHVCVISPERLGLCGAYNWLDTKASYQIDPTGPNQPILKGECYDDVRGKWRGVDEFIVKASAGKVENFSAYSIMDNPMTSCGCFECILAVVPEANGVMIVHRGFNGMTPTGMKFSTMAGTVGGGLQTPGFMGVGRYFVISKKFLLADGGLKRIVWMTKDLKNSFREQLMKRGAEEGVPDLLDKIADEDVCTESDKLMEHLQKVKHPALEMASIL
ncbi:MAG: CO dehydrogenase/CO-methylating acetyl-CoA synthase complex subunit beta, partial [Nitrospirota bacterium]